jgi:hypothetical protein
MQKCKGLEFAQRANTASLEKAWPTQASYNEDGASLDGLLG